MCFYFTFKAGQVDDFFLTRLSQVKTAFLPKLLSQFIFVLTVANFTNNQLEKLNLFPVRDKSAGYSFDPRKLFVIFKLTYKNKSLVNKQTKSNS